MHRSSPTTNNKPIHFIFQNSFDPSSSSLMSIINSTPNNLESLLINPPYELTLTIDKLLAPSKRKSYSKTSPPRPQNGFILFKKDLAEKLKRSNTKLQLSENAKYAKFVWDNQSDEVKQFFQFLCFTCIKEHKEKYPNYKYNPKKNKVSKSSSPQIKSKSKDEISISSQPSSCINDTTLQAEDSIMSEYFDFSLWECHQR